MPHTKKAIFSGAQGEVTLGHNSGQCLIPKRPYFLVLTDGLLWGIIQGNASYLSLAGAASSTIFVAIKHVFCHDKSMLVTTFVMEKKNPT